MMARLLRDPDPTSSDPANRRDELAGGEAVLQHRPSRQKIDEVTMKLLEGLRQAVRRNPQRTLRFWSSQQIEK